ncbi:hypothetical protein JOM56_015600 [Amanita muscaria]
MDTTLDYLDIPSTATLLHSSRFQPAPKITTSLPSPSPPISAPTSPTLDSVPNFILAATLPTGLFSPSTPTTPTTPSAPASSAAPPPAPPLLSHTRSPSKSNRPAPLLSSKDPLSLPITSTNFRRFIACVGPAFWVQDRAEEIVLWKKGWKWTTLWVLLYGGLCRFPQLILCIPHVILIAVILITYPYPATHDLTSSKSQSLPQPPPLAGQRPSPSQTQDPPPAAATSSLASLPYQANLQAIQNLMGTFSDLMDFVKPLVRHLVLTPASLSTISHSRSASSTSTSSASSNSSSSILTTQSSPYTIHILTLLVLTLPPLLILVSLPSFPLRLAMFIAGAGPIFALHPWVKDEILPALVVVAVWAWNRPVPAPLIYAYMRLVRFTRSISGTNIKTLDKYHNHTELKSLIERLIDNNQLPDECWISEMRQVELWENERYVGPLPAVETGGQGLATKPSYSSFSSVGSVGSLGSFGSLKSLGSIGSTGARKGTWSKANLRPTDRAGWTRWRDGWNGVNATNSTAATDGQDMCEEYAGVDRLTFPLAPGWSFVDTEDWRKDISAEWALALGDGDRAGVVDEDGWMYTNDSWMEGTPYVTRRRRWVRRVWFDPNKAREYRVPLEA